MLIKAPLKISHDCAKLYAKGPKVYRWGILSPFYEELRQFVWIFAQQQTPTKGLNSDTRLLPFLPSTDGEGESKSTRSYLESKGQHKCTSRDGQQACLKITFGEAPFLQILHLNGNPKANNLRTKKIN